MKPIIVDLQFGLLRYFIVFLVLYCTVNYYIKRKVIKTKLYLYDISYFFIKKEFTKLYNIFYYTYKVLP